MCIDKIDAQARHLINSQDVASLAVLDRLTPVDIWLVFQNAELFMTASMELVKLIELIRSSEGRGDGEF